MDKIQILPFLGSNLERAVNDGCYVKATFAVSSPNNGNPILEKTIEYGKSGTHTTITEHRYYPGATKEARDADICRDYYVNRMTEKEIAKKYGLSQQQVSNIVRRYAGFYN